MSDGLDLPEEGEESPYVTLLAIGGKNGDAGLEVLLSRDEMEVRGNFTPPTGGKLLVYAEIEESLQNLGVVHGIQTRLIQEAIYHCNMDKQILSNVILAQGTQPVSERPAYLKLEERLYHNSFPQNRQALQVDFKDYSPFIIVKKGELLARAVKPRAGVQGLTVKNNPLPFGKKDIKFLKPGTNTVYVKGQVFSRCAGRFAIEGDVFQVSDVLELKEGVDYSTGHIMFPGHVYIGGQVQDGFRVVAGGNIEVKETLDASEVMAKGNLNCHSGIIGRRPGVVRTGGELRAVFLENVQIEALKDVHISKTILSSQVYSNGHFSMDEGGKIVSSLVSCRGNFSCQQLGNETSHTHVIAGVDFVAQRKLEHLRAQYQEEEDQLVKVQARLDQMGTEHLAQAAEEIRARILKIVEEINGLQEKYVNSDNFEVQVKGDIYPGCVIEMGWARLEITHKQTGGKVFRLSADKKTILTDKFHPAD